MQFNKRFYGFLFIKVALAILFLSHAYAGIILRPLWNDGSAWLYNVINNQSFYHDTIYNRLIVYLPQIVPNILAALFPGRASIAPEVYSFTMFYALFPYAVLAFIGFYLKKKNQIQLIIFPFLYFLLIHAGAQSFYVNVATDVSMVLWTILFFCWFEEGIELVCLLLPGLVYIYFGYELAPLYYGTIMLTLLYRHYVKKNLPFKEGVMLPVALFLLGLVYTFNFVFLKKVVGSAHVNSVFLKSLMEVPTGIALFSIISLVLVLLSLKIKRQIFIQAIILIAFIFCLYQICDAKIHALFKAAYDSRTTVYFRNFLLLLIFLAYDYFNVSKKLLWTIAACGIILSLAESSRLNVAWVKGLNRLQYLSSKTDGCGFVTKKVFHPYFGRQGLIEWSFPYLSVLSASKREVKSILFITLDEIDDDTNPCLHVWNKNIVHTLEFPVHIPVNTEDGFHFPFLSEKDGITIQSWKENHVKRVLDIWSAEVLLSKMFKFRKNIPYEFIIPMKGSPLKGIYPLAQISVGEIKIDEVVVSGEMVNYSFQVRLDSDQEASIKIKMLNDDFNYETKEDRNLQIGGIFFKPYKD